MIPMTILLDKCQMKSYVNINISIKVKFLWVKNFFLKKLFFEKKHVFEIKKKCFFDVILLNIPCLNVRA